MKIHPYQRNYIIGLLTLLVVVTTIMRQALEMDSFAVAITTLVIGCVGGVIFFILLLPKNKWSIIGMILWSVLIATSLNLLRGGGEWMKWAAATGAITWISTRATFFAWHIVHRINRRTDDKK